MATYKYTVIRDTREKEGHGWMFAKEDRCCGTLIQKLDTGDYSLVGFENRVVIERKGSVSEWATNIFDDRFTRELDRLLSFPYPFIICEFDVAAIYAFPAQSGIPKTRWRYMKLRGPQIIKRTVELQMQYPTINVVFAGKRGKDYASCVMKRFMDVYPRRNR